MARQPHRLGADREHAAGLIPVVSDLQRPSQRHMLSESQDAQVRQRIWNVIYSMGADKNVVKEWNITDENRS